MFTESPRVVRAVLDVLSFFALSLVVLVEAAADLAGVFLAAVAAGFEAEALVFPALLEPDMDMNASSE